MLQSYKRLTNPNPKLRLSTGHFLDQGRKSGGFFETPLIRLTQDIESLGLKNDAERDEFVKYDISNSVPEATSREVNVFSAANWTSFQMISLKNSLR